MAPPGPAVSGQRASCKAPIVTLPSAKRARPVRAWEFTPSSAAGTPGISDPGAAVAAQEMAAAGAGNYMDCVGVHFNDGTTSQIARAIDSDVFPAPLTTFSMIAAS